MAHADRFALICLLVDLRARVIVHSEWPRHAYAAVCELEEAGLLAFAVGMRWAELDGHHAFQPLKTWSFDMSTPMPGLIVDLPVMSVSFREGYLAMVGNGFGEALTSSENHLFLSVPQAATYLARPEHDVLRLMNESVLACQWYGGERRISFKDLEVYRVRDRKEEALAIEALLIVAELIEQQSSIRAA